MNTLAIEKEATKVPYIVYVMCKSSSCSKKTSIEDSEFLKKCPPIGAQGIKSSTIHRKLMGGRQANGCREGSMLHAESPEARARDCVSVQRK